MYQWKYTKIVSNKRISTERISLDTYKNNGDSWASCEIELEKQTSYFTNNAGEIVENTVFYTHAKLEFKDIGFLFKDSFGDVGTSDSFKSKDEAVKKVREYKKNVEEFLENMR